MRYTYGVYVCNPFDDDVHPESKKEWYEDKKKWYCTDVFSKFVTGSAPRSTSGVSIRRLTYYVMQKKQSVIALKIFVTKVTDPKFTDEIGVEFLTRFDVKVPGTGLDRGVKVDFRFGDAEIRARVVDVKDNTLEREFSFQYHQQN